MGHEVALPPTLGHSFGSKSILFLEVANVPPRREVNHKAELAHGFGLGAVGYLTVTAVDSGSKALEFLGIHDEQGTSPSGSSESQVLKA
ncbi:hypothetical protein AAC387_Pa08g1132 [Persea americana]